MPIQSDYPSLDAGEMEAIKLQIIGFEGFFPKVLNLSAKEKYKHQTIKNKREVFVDMVLQQAKNNPMVVPAFASVPYLEEKFSNFHLLQSIEIALEGLLEKVRDTSHNEGHFAYKEALKIFDSIRLARNSQVPGIDAVYESLNHLFAKAGRKKKLS